jgi:hypothetical protein
VKRRVLVVFPTTWDERQFAALPEDVRARYELVFDEPRDADVPWNLDVLAYVDARARTWRGRLAGVFSSSDYPGAAVAAALAHELGLPGAPPASVLVAGHKLRARELHAAALPAHVPCFAAFDPCAESSWPPEERFPCFVKPVRGSFSLLARQIEDRSALAAFVRQAQIGDFRAHYPRMAEALAARYAPAARAAGDFLAEEPLCGVQVTFEGFLSRGAVRPLGLVDSSFHAETRSFEAFDYPSRLPSAVQARIAQAAGRAAQALGLDQTLFNAEFLWDVERDRLGLIELNPRLCGQFGDLYAKVDGTSGFEVGLALACGEEPQTPLRAGPHAAAASLPLRTFRSVRVTRAPVAAALRRAEGLHPGTLIWSECGEGDELRIAPDVEDGASVRYCVVNLGGQNRADLRRRLAQVERALGYGFQPIPLAGR